LFSFETQLAGLIPSPAVLHRDLKPANVLVTAGKALFLGRAAIDEFSEIAAVKRVMTVLPKS
jgi:hypothetical protein